MILLLGYIYIYVCVLYTSNFNMSNTPHENDVDIYIYISCGSPLVKNSVLHMFWLPHLYKL